MFEKHRVADSGVASVDDVDFMTPIMVPCISNVEATCSVGCPQFPNILDKMGFNFTSQWSKRIGVVIVLLPKVSLG